MTNKIYMDHSTLNLQDLNRNRVPEGGYQPQIGLLEEKNFVYGKECILYSRAQHDRPKIEKYRYVRDSTAVWCLVEWREGEYRYAKLDNNYNMYQDQSCMSIQYLPNLMIQYTTNLPGLKDYCRLILHDPMGRLNKYSFKVETILPDSFFSRENTNDVEETITHDWGTRIESRCNDNREEYIRWIIKSIRGEYKNILVTVNSDTLDNFKHTEVSKLDTKFMFGSPLIGHDILQPDGQSYSIHLTHTSRNKLMAQYSSQAYREQIMATLSRYLFNQTFTAVDMLPYKTKLRFKA